VGVSKKQNRTSLGGDQVISRIRSPVDRRQDPATPHSHR
jgi:hypothetical protein